MHANEIDVINGANMAIVRICNLTQRAASPKEATSTSTVKNN
jgi:hypothetical protein